MVKEIFAKTILNRHEHRDSWFLDDYSVGPYHGCPFSCIYCYLKGSKYGERMEKEFSVKVNAPELLEKALIRYGRQGKQGFIAFAGQEVYPPEEEKIKMTRKLLEIALNYKFPVHILTKSTMVPRDFDILHKIDAEAILPKDLKEKLGRGVILSFSFSTPDESVRKIFEPNAPSVEERLKTMQRCAEEGFVTGVTFIPALPYISDTEEKMEEMVIKAKENGAQYILVGGLTLFGEGPGDCKNLVLKALEKHFPELLPKYKELFKTPYPERFYREELCRKAKAMCEKHKLRYTILQKP